MGIAVATAANEAPKRTSSKTAADAVKPPDVPPAKNRNDCKVPKSLFATSRQG